MAGNMFQVSNQVNLEAAPAIALGARDDDGGGLGFWTH
mgnify:CR=1 FL=1